MEERRHFLTKPIPALQPFLANSVEEPKAHACPLPFRHYDEPARPRLFKSGPRRNSKMGNRRPPDGRDVASCRHHFRHLQIVMRLKKRPVTPVGFVNFKVKLWASPKPPPGVFALLSVIYPVGLKPVNYVIVARK